MMDIFRERGGGEQRDIKRERVRVSKTSRSILDSEFLTYIAKTKMMFAGSDLPLSIGLT